MLLEPLVSAIETIKTRISTHGPTLRENETRTRMALVDPLLQALAWDTSDPSLVLPEFDVSGRKADYALLGRGGSPSATVEAKKLGEPLAPHRMQMLNYSNASGVEYAGLTDGDKWELYEVFKRGQLEERRVLNVSIAEEPVHEVALKLLLLWRPNLESGQPVAANEPVFVSTRDQVEEPTPSEPQPVSTPVVAEARRSSLSAAPPREGTISSTWIPLSQISHATVDRRPAEVKFAGQTPIAIRSWNQVLIQTTEWLCKEGTLTSRHCPIAREGGRGSRYLVSTNPVHKNGADFAQPYKTSIGLYLEVNHSARSCVNLAKELLNQLAASTEVVQIKFE